MGFRRPRARGGFGTPFWIAWLVCGLGLVSCASDDEPHDGAQGGSSGSSGESSGGNAASGGRTGGSAGIAATGGRPATGGTGGTSGNADGGRTGGEAGSPGSSTGGSGPQAGAPSSAGSGNGGEGGAGGSESEPGGAAGRAVSGGAGGSGPEPPELNGCIEYVDRTAPSALRTVLWDASIAFAAERCLKIRAHQDVVFDGDFDAHPLEPLGGDMPSPFSGGHWSFSRPGVFGYICSIHSEMTGAIWVVP